MSDDLTGLDQNATTGEIEKADSSIDFSSNVVRLAVIESVLSELSIAVDSITTRIAQLKREHKFIEERTRKQAWDWFMKTGDIQPHPAISIKTVRSKTYLTDDNLRTAIDNDLHYLLSPDPQQVDAIIEALNESGRVDLLVLDKAKVRAAIKKHDSALIPQEEVNQQVWIQSNLEQYIGTEE